jgi:transposase
MARPTKLDDVRVAKILDLLERGNSRRTAALVAGISDATLKSWTKRGREARDLAASGGKPKRADLPFVDFLDRVEEAEEKAVARNVENVRVAAEAGTWQASAWWLERRRPDDFARRVHVRHGGDDGAGPVRLSVEERQRLVGELAGKTEVVGAVSRALAADVDFDGPDPTFEG